MILFDCIYLVWSVTVSQSYLQMEKLALLDLDLCSLHWLVLWPMGGQTLQSSFIFLENSWKVSVFLWTFSSWLLIKSSDHDLSGISSPPPPVCFYFSFWLSDRSSFSGSHVVISRHWNKGPNLPSLILSQWAWSTPWSHLFWTETTSFGRTKAWLFSPDQVPGEVSHPSFRLGPDTKVRKSRPSDLGVKAPLNLNKDQFHRESVNSDNSSDTWADQQWINSAKIAKIFILPGNMRL